MNESKAWGAAIAALVAQKAMCELLIAKGIVTRDEALNELLAYRARFAENAGSDLETLMFLDTLIFDIKGGEKRDQAKALLRSPADGTA